MPSSKRASSLSEEEDDFPNKRSRRSSSVSANQAKLAGCVEKVYMKNFMCHSSLEVTLNKNINFVVGRNGSGKSAILAAVVVALGCKAASTNRATALKDFIKVGAPSALVQVTLCNEGLHSYKPEVYGPKIVVVRNINVNCSTTYKFKSAKGEVISTKREELDKIITTMNIQVDNPISVLNQEVARTFLASSDPKSKYSIFMKATKLEDVDQLHSRTLNCEANVANRLKLRRESMLSQHNEIKELEKKANALKKLEETRSRAVILENEYCWALARDQETLLTELQCKIEKEKESVVPHQDRVQKFKQDCEEKSNAMRVTRTQLEGITDKFKESSQRFLKSNEELKEMKTLYRSSLQKYKQFAKEEKKYKIDMQTVRQAIERHKGGQENAQERKSLLEAIHSCKVEQDKINNVQNTVDIERKNLNVDFDAICEKEIGLRNERRTVEQAIGLKNNQLQNLKSQGNNLSVYANWMPRLVQRIEDCDRQRQFVRKPLGPLGSLLRVKDAQWARAIEIEMGSILQSFACHCVKDSKILQQLFREVIPSGCRYPGILVSKFTDRLHNIRDTSVRFPGFKNIFEALHISDVNVANFLIDNVNIEAILLIPTGEEAVEMMSKNVPKNCKKSVTLKADQYFPYPDYRMYAANQRIRVSLLQVSKQEIIRDLEVELETERKNLFTVDGQLKDTIEQKHQNRVRAKEVEKRIQDLRTARSKLSIKINEYENAIDAIPNPQDFLTLNSELENLQRKIDEVLQKCKEANQESDVLKIQCDQASEKTEAIQAELKEFEETRQKLQIELASQKEIVRKAESKVKDFETYLDEHNSKVHKMIELLKKQEKQTEDAVKQASNVCPQRIITKRPVHKIKSDIIDAKTYQDMVEKSTGVTVDVLDILKEKKRKYQENLDQMANIESGLKALSNSLGSRKGLYKIIRRIMALKVVYVFKPLLKTRGYKGDMVFDHEAKSLDVQISPKQENGNRETKSLSGGERSYSTVSFILALWECVEPPFYFMDEFDVFMDKVNRRVVIEMLLMQARQKKKHQYVFFTPQDTSIVLASEDVTIHKLDDPERSATALSQIV